MRVKTVINKIFPPFTRRLFRKVFKEKAKQTCRKEIAALGNNIKLVVGTGYTHFEEWVSTDIHQLNILLEKDWKYLLNGKKAINILSEHVWEHIAIKP
jgi:hypothetical protein